MKILIKFTKNFRNGITISQRIDNRINYKKQ